MLKKKISYVPSNKLFNSSLTYLPGCKVGKFGMADTANIPTK